MDIKSMINFLLFWVFTNNESFFAPIMKMGLKTYNGEKLGLDLIFQW